MLIYANYCSLRVSVPQIGLCVWAYVQHELCPHVPTCVGGLNVFPMALCGRPSLFSSGFRCYGDESTERWRAMKIIICPGKPIKHD